METTFNSEPAFPMETPPPFNVVILYEDFSAGKHAKKTYDYLTQQLQGDYEFTSQMWKFNVLANPKMQKMAVKDAVMADLVIVAAHGLGELPGQVKSWAEQWVPKKSNAMAALVALVNPPVGEEAPHALSIRNYLQDAAQRAGIGFFTQPADWTDQEDDFTAEPDSHSAQRASNLMANFFQNNSMSLQAHPSFPVFAGTSRWGINE